jgi:hypothetical protein
LAVVNAQADARVTVLLPATINESREMGSKPEISTGHQLSDARLQR